MQSKDHSASVYPASLRDHSVRSFVEGTRLYRRVRERLLSDPTLFCGAVFFENNLVDLLHSNNSRYDLVAILRVMQQIGIVERQSGRERGGWRVRTVTVTDHQQIVEAARSDELLMVSLLADDRVDPDQRHSCIAAMRKSLEALQKPLRARAFVRGFFDFSLIIPQQMKWWVHEQRLRATLEYARFARIVFPDDIESMIMLRQRIVDSLNDPGAAERAVRACWEPLMVRTSALYKQIARLSSAEDAEVECAAQQVVTLCWPMVVRILCEDTTRPDGAMVQSLSLLQPEVSECIATLARCPLSRGGVSRVPFHDVAVPVFVTVLAQLAKSRWQDLTPLFDCISVPLSEQERKTFDRFLRTPQQPRSGTDRAILSRVRRKLALTPPVLQMLIEEEIPKRHRACGSETAGGSATVLAR